MSVIDPDDSSELNDGEAGDIECDSSHYSLSRHDRRLLDAATRMLHRMAGAPGLSHKDLVGIGFAIYALRRMPQPTAGLEMELTVSTPLLGGDAFRIQRSWTISFEGDPAVRLASGGWVEFPGTGGESFTRFEWYAALGGAAESTDNTDSLSALDSVQWPREIPPFQPWTDELNAIAPGETYQLEAALTTYPAGLEDIEPEEADEEEEACSAEDDESSGAIPSGFEELWLKWFESTHPKPKP